jgi:hypothetical protein
MSVGLVKEKVTEVCRVRGKNLHNLYSLPSVIRIIRSSSMRWIRRVARMGGERNV